MKGGQWLSAEPLNAAPPRLRARFFMRSTVLISRNPHKSCSCRVPRRWALMAGVDRPPALRNRVISGGRLNVARALTKLLGRPDPPAPVQPPSEQVCSCCSVSCWCCGWQQAGSQPVCPAQCVSGSFTPRRPLWCSDLGG